MLAAYFSQLSEKRRKIRTVFKVVSVAVHILPQQSDFLISLVKQCINLGNYIFCGAAAFPPSHIRNYAISAEIVAAVNYVYPCVGAACPENRAVVVVSEKITVEKSVFGSIVRFGDNFL